MDFDSAHPSTGRPLAGRELVVWGHPQTVTVKDQKVRVHDKPLEELRTYLTGIPESQREKFKSRHSPELTLQVLSLEGNLQAGDSGAPVLDPEGFAIAMADGGLDGGFGGVVWAVVGDDVNPRLIDGEDAHQLAATAL